MRAARAASQKDDVLTFFRQTAGLADLEPHLIATTYCGQVFRERRSSGSNDSIYAAVYGAGSWGGLSLRVGGFYAWQEFDVSRTVVFPNFSDHTEASYNGWTAQAFGELGYQINPGDAVTLEPFLGGSVMRLHMDGFREEGGAAALVGNSRNHDLETMTLGVSYSGQFGARALANAVKGNFTWRFQTR